MVAGANRRVIILDDEEIVYEMLVDFFTERGYTIVAQETFLANCTAITGGPHTCQAPCADVIVTDHHLGELIGLDILEKLIGSPCDIRHKAVISGAFMPRDEVRAQQLGCRLFRKPFSITELEEWLDEVEKEPV